MPRGETRPLVVDPSLYAPRRSDLPSGAQAPASNAPDAAGVAKQQKTMRSLERPPAPPAKGRSLVPFAVLAGLLVVGALGALAWRARGEATTAPAASAPPATAISELVLLASPAEAVIYLDGEPVGDNPARMKLARDGTAHVVRAEAPGYVTKEESLSLDGSLVTVELALDRVVQPAPEPAPAAEEPAAEEPAEPAETTAEAPIQPASGGARPRAAERQSPPKPEARSAAAAAAEVKQRAPSAPSEPARRKAPVLDRRDPWE